jgi:acetyl-CoA carboxylase biotin carboxyl carrier protein
MAKRVAQAAGVQEETVASGEASGAFTLAQVKALVSALEGTDVTSFRWTRAGQQIAIRRGAPPVAAPVVHHAAVAAPAPHRPQVLAVAPPASPVLQAAPSPAPRPDAKPGVVVTSPFVGTFYRAPSPDSAPFVEVGTVVKKGQALCIVEAMKLMNEIEADAPGKIAEILVQNGTPVEFGQALFRVEPA